MKNKAITPFVSIVILLIFSCKSQQKEWDIRDYGAVADTTVKNTQAIQKTIDACAKAGGGKVVVTSGTYVSGTILLKDNVELHITENSKLIASDNPNDFYAIDAFIDATGQYRGQCFIGASDVKNIAITGKGIIDGNGTMFTPKNVRKTYKRLGVTPKKPDISELIAKNDNYVSKKIRWSNRPFLVRFVRVSNTKIREITLRQPAAWTLHFFQCDTFEVDNINIYSKANQNNDGIDIDSSSNGIIKNCTINSDDDAICFKTTSLKPTTNISVTNCKLSSDWGAIKFGTESMGAFEDITIKDCFITDTHGGGIKILSVDGANMNNIWIDNIKMTAVEMPIFIRLGERLLTYRSASKQAVGTMNNITISNIDIISREKEHLRLFPTTGIFITGTPNHKIDNLTLENIKISLPGGGTLADTNTIVPENETKYPEFINFGVSPAYGMYARHVKNLNTKNVSFELLSSDERKDIITLDVNN
ncbi:glycosyl hydrolase family 28 protein [uncultured Algibacter sp.]|uniref:glycoside hydrolase family 28 protein n=1 Tax=uncultured Algibacter sp. TaxID=298659 RepID=UPI0032167000